MSIPASVTMKAGISIMATQKPCQQPMISPMATAMSTATVPQR